MFKITAALLIGSAVSVSANAFDLINGILEENIKMQCAIVKNGKAVQKQSCIAKEGWVYANSFTGSSTGYTFKPIKNYGAISVSEGSEFIKDANDNFVLDKHGNQIQVSYTRMNDKPAKITYRHPKTFKKLSQAQEKRFENGSKLKFTPYTCFTYAKNATFEFCFSKPLVDEIHM